MKKAIPPAAAAFDDLPDSAHVRDRVVSVVTSYSRSSVWRLVQEGVLPAPRKLGPGLTAWNVGELRQYLRSR